jgi:pyrimidine deaminase RibD-like protein
LLYFSEHHQNESDRMDHLDFMNLAITMASKCRPLDPSKTPRVGAVVAIDDQVVAAAFRGADDHAEKIALEEAAERGADLTRAVVYTTLEPCVGGVRRLNRDACADRLVAAAVKKVVIGIHDPNIGVTGQGFLRLQEAHIETELFPRALAEQVKLLNRQFILANQRIGAKITFPENNSHLATEPGKFVTLRGTWVNPPREGEHVYVVVQRGNQWWPQSELEAAGAGGWRSRVGIGDPGDHTVFVGKVNQLGKLLFDYYRKIIAVHEIWRTKLKESLNKPDFEFPGNDWVAIGVEGSTPPKGIDSEDMVQFNITEIIPKPET